MHISKEGLLAYFPYIRYTRYTNILKIFGDIDSLWRQDTGNLIKKLGWKPKLASDFILWKNNLNISKIEKELQENKISLVTYSDKSYPFLLKEIHSPPLCLFVRGSIENIKLPLAIVGTRKYSEYGMFVCKKIVSELKEYNFTIISGLAYGIDTIAHREALETGSRTIAVLGSGIDTDSITPACNRRTANEIIQSGGAIISEYPPGTAPTKYSFPERNRIISGMCLGTLVIEAPNKSGALITSDFALEHNREVFAIPHNITNISGVGPNKLISQGAHMVLSSKDILNVFKIPYNKTQNNDKKIVNMSTNEQKIYKILSEEPKYIDEIINMVDLKNYEITSTLTTLELKGVILQMSGKKYVRKQ